MQVIFSCLGVLHPFHFERILGMFSLCCLIACLSACSFPNYHCYSTKNAFQSIFYHSAEYKLCYLFALTLSQTSRGFYLSAVEVFRNTV